MEEKNSLAQTVRAKLRSIILPSDMLVNHISEYLAGNKSLLDVGAGTGYFLRLMLQKRLIDYGYGTEVASQYYTETSNYSIKPIEEYNRHFEVISLIDVLHHIPDKKSFLQNITSSQLCTEETIFFIKDISPQVFIYRIWNTLHDVIFNQQIPIYIKEAELIMLMKEHRYEPILISHKKVFLYDHFLMIFKRCNNE